MVLRTPQIDDCHKHREWDARICHLHAITVTVGTLLGGLGCWLAQHNMFDRLLAKLISVEVTTEAASQVGKKFMLCPML